MLRSDVRARLLTEFGGRARPYPDDRNVLQLIEDRAQRSPGSPAVVFDGTTLSYGTLDRRANALATQLASRGVGRGDLVPLIVRDGLELPMSVLALMKLGAPFVPVDDLWPAARLAEVVGAVRPKLVLHAADVPAEPVPEDLRFALDVAALPERDRPDTGAPAGMDDIVYGFFTSGSTGTPKCTLNVHRGLLNRFLYMTRELGDSADDVALQNSRHVFDSSIWQLLWPLTKGARVVIPRRDGVLDLSSTVDTIERYGITTTDFVPSIFNTLVDMVVADPALVGRLGSLRTILIGGEEINSRAVQRFRAMLPDVRIVNTYGPTECSIGSVFHTVTDADAESIPIGRPIDNTYVVVLDDDGELVAPGEIGEIAIGGDCVGLGYLGDPGRTAAVLRVNPFPEIPGDRLYRTGDHGRWRDDGVLVFEGRSDQQIKIGGVRVELSEIEIALHAHPGVREAKAVAGPDRGGRVLIAFVTCDDGLSVPALREHARSALPPYLVPRRFVILDRMPLTPNGKTDRRALAAMADSPDDVAADLEGTEREVQQIWHRLMPGTRAGSSDDFFDVGGDSLIAQRLALALNARFGTAFTVRDVVRRPTITGQAAAVRGERDATSASDDMIRDAMLPADIVAATSTATATGGPRTVLLTGATGFLGAQLAHDLLSDPDTVLYCLVRADDPVAAGERVAENLRGYRLWDDGFSDRVRAVPGDLAAPRLGLTDERHRDLAAATDVVLHNGAMVNLVRGYGAHRAANVDGTVEILRLACRGRTTPVHFVSTLSVLPPGGGEAPVPTSHRPEDGYSRSKLVGEWLTDAAAERGLPVAVHRLGEVMPHSRLGVPSRDGLADLLVRACVRLGVTFRSEVTLDYLPVDRASALVVAAVDRAGTGYFHHRQAESVRLDDLLDEFRKTFDLADVSYRDFLGLLGPAAENDRDLRRVATMLPSAECDLPALFSTPAAGRPAPQSDRLARDAGLSWPPVGGEVFHHYAAAVPGRTGPEPPGHTEQRPQTGPRTWI